MRSERSGLRAWIASVALVWAGAGAHAQSPIPVEVLPLNNGMTAILHVDRRQPNIAMVMQLQIGARHEAPDRAGIASLIKRLQFHGSDHLPYGQGYYLFPPCL